MFVLQKHFIEKTNKDYTILKCYDHFKTADGVASQVETTKWCQKCRTPGAGHYRALTFRNFVLSVVNSCIN